MGAYFEALSCLGKRIRITEDHWQLITQRKHPEIDDLEQDVQLTLIEAEIVRISQEDENVFLYYRRFKKYHLCVVCRHLDGEGFIITCYLTDRLKEGHEVWRK
ncbi:MAG: DUF4258 domain-containing protein [Elusimicrobia bacterium]|nr:DUF4258 domain-containing protein [Elusimicrobiota bacterium]